jgi:amino acid adenylation domain-containing protein
MTLANLANLGFGFVASAARYPDRPAVVLGERAITYAALDRTARVWAAAIVLGTPAAEVPGRAKVGILGKKSEVAYAGTLAALLAGATFVPLNPAFPRERTRAMLAAAAVDVLIVEDGAKDQVAALIADLPKTPFILAPASDACSFAAAGARVTGQETLARLAPLAAPRDVPPEAVAYLMFTSGSTGRPKGVPITHANVTSFLRTNQARYALGPDDRLSQTFDPTFDLSIFDMFMAWNAGACVCPALANDLADPVGYVARHAITVWFAVPAVASLLGADALEPDAMPSLRYSLFCGEALPRDTAAAWQAAAPQSMLENLYGPTELTVACSAYRWDPARSPDACVNGLVPIGKAYEGLEAVVVDGALADVAPGEDGELCVAGPQAFPGYWNDEVATAARVFTRPGPDGTARRFYRTGDRVRRAPSGDLVFLGRIDFQVKVNGYRIELGEIEAVLAEQPGVTAAVAVGWPLEQGAPRGLVAFASAAGAAPDKAALQAALAARLPAYMVPWAIYVLPTFPVNANGKIDRKELLRGLEDCEYEDA